MTHQEIINALEAIGDEHSAAYKLELARINAERARLQDLCSTAGHEAVGHVYAKSKDLFVSAYPRSKRECIFCQAQEPTAS